jgi:hypothetical protein
VLCLGLAGRLRPATIGAKSTFLSPRCPLSTLIALVVAVFAVVVLALFPGAGPILSRMKWNEVSAPFLGTDAARGVGALAGH